MLSFMCGISKISHEHVISHSYIMCSNIYFVISACSYTRMKFVLTRQMMIQNRSTTNILSTNKMSVC